MPPATSGRAIATAVATAAVLISVIGVSLVSNPADPERETPALELPETAALVTPDIETAASGGEIVWELAEGVAATQLVARPDGTVLAFGPSDVVTRRGLALWELGTDGAWEAHGATLGTAYDAPLIHAGDQLVAVSHGSPWAAQFPELAGGTLLVSDNGRGWTERSLPMVAEAPYAVADLVVAGAGRALVRSVDRPPEELLMWETLGGGYVTSAFSFDVIAAGTGEASLVIDALNMAVETLDRPSDAPGGPARERFWVTNDYRTWVEVPPPLADESIVEWEGFYDGSRYIINASTGKHEPTSFFLVSDDLVSWDLAGSWQDLHDLQPAGSSGYLARQDGGGRTQLFESDTLGAWEPITASDTEAAGTPDSAAVDVGGLGTALVYANRTSNRAPVTFIRSGELAIVVEPPQSRIIVLSEDGPILGLSYDATTPNPAIRYAPDTDALEIASPIGGSGRVTITAREVLAALYATESSEEFDSSLLYSSDQEQWRQFDLTAEIGVSGPVLDVAVTDDRIVVAYGPSNGSPAQVWVGTPARDR